MPCKAPPLVSLLVPVYGVEPYIARCAHGLFGQSYANIEYIFIDDCSPDGSVEVLREVLAQYPHRVEQVRIVRHDRNLGVAGTRNTAISLAMGDWVLMHDSDDWLESDAVERLVELTGEGVDMVICDFYMAYPDKTTPYLYHGDPKDGVEWFRSILSSTDYILWAVWCKLLRRTLFDDPSFHVLEGANMGEDLGIMMQLTGRIRGVRHLPAELVYYRQRVGSYCGGPLTPHHINSFCRNVEVGISSLRSQGVYERVEREFAGCMLRYLYDRIYRADIDSGAPVRMLKHEVCRWLFRRDTGVGLRKRLVVCCGVYDWHRLRDLLLSINASWQRMARDRKKNRC